MEPMEPGFAVFNCHINNARQRANIWFAKKYGKDAYQQHIKPLHKNGIMSVFDKPPTPYTQAWVDRVTWLVNTNGLGSPPSVQPRPQN